MTSMDDSYDLNMAAAMLRSNSTDLRLLLKALSEGLSDTLGDRLQVQRSGSRFKKSDVISSVQITMASDQFEAVVDGSDLRCTVGHFSGGIRIRNENVDVSAWIVKLLEALRVEAAHSDTARQALENLVIGGNT
jgi:hypothetical protein